MGPKHRVLLVGINYEPEQTGIGPYTTGIAVRLADRGHEVTVLTGVPHYPQWKVDPAYRRKIWVRERRDGVDVRRVRHYVPARHSAPKRGLYELTFFLQSMVTVRLPESDCVIGVVPSLGGGAAAALLARRLDVPLGLLFQDLVGRAVTQSGIRGGGLAAAPAKMIEARVARQACRIAIVAEAFRPPLIELGVDPERIVHLPNWSHVNPPRRSAGAVREAMGWPTDRPIVLHAGNMGHKQGLESVIDAARKASLEGSDLLFVLMGDGNERRRLETLGADLDNLEFVDPQPQESFMDVLGAADVLLINERRSVLDMSLPSKITSYFCAGRPVVAAVRPEGATAEELEGARAALVVPPENPTELILGVGRVVNDKGLARTLVENAHAYARQHLNREELLSRAEVFVETVAACRDVGIGASPHTEERSGSGGA